MSESINKNYNPKDIEDRIYKKWIDNKTFRADENSKKEPFTIVMPPPNVTGKLHMGHALDISIQDSIIRYKRMKGYETLWQPGTDHAAISTEVKVTDKLKSQGIDKYEIGREKFLVEAWKWKEEYEHNIIEQQMKMGASCDWDRLRFTMDEGCSKAVLYTFKKLYEKGLIYKGEKIINWCPHCKTTISDAEVNYVEKEGNFYHLKYFFVDDKSKYLTLATTRPETLLGDTAVAVNPNDDRYKSIIGKKVYVPIINREIEVVADDYVDMEFGTGIVKITPSHDPNDFEVGLRHNLKQICILTDEGKITCEGTSYDGLDRYEARKKIVEDLEKAGNLVKIEPHNHNVGTHDRCNEVIEPMVKSQWFVKMEPLAKPAIEAIENGSLRFVPDSYKNTYLHWLNNIKDWCISRQIWWGHRIPVFYCDDCNEVIVKDDLTEIKTCPKCGSTHIHQDEDTLDTWFSSALWPFSTLGWPEETNSYKKFYPTNVLVTGYDIIFFWVVRMVFSGIEQTGKCPFDEVLIHGIVRDKEGRKMSKMLNNGIDPLDIINEYGADALRLNLLTGNAPGNDMRFFEERVISKRNFLNKVWNASRFILMNDIDDIVKKDVEIDDILNLNLHTEDKWILSLLNERIKTVERNMNNYDLGIALDNIEQFIWEEFCDWYIEIVKTRLYGDNKDDKIVSLKVLKYILNTSLKILHPFSPFITEEIFENFNNNKFLILEKYPEYDTKLCFEKEEKSLSYAKEVIKGIRNRRNDLKVPNSKKTNLIVVTKDSYIKNIYIESERFFKTLAFVTDIKIIDDISKDSDLSNLDNFINITFDKSSVYLPLYELVDINKEKEKLKNEIEKMQSEVKRGENMLNNQNFLSKAKPEKIEEEKTKLLKYKSILLELLQKYEKL